MVIVVCRGSFKDKYLLSIYSYVLLWLQIAAAGKKVHVVTPDLGEYSRSYKMFKSSLDMIEGVTMGHLKESSKGDFLNGFQSLFSGGAPDSAPAGGWGELNSGFPSSLRAEGE